MKISFKQILNWTNKPTDIASLVLLRIAFGLLMFWEMTRYYYNGWIREFYVNPEFHYKYEWFDWLGALPSSAMYLFFASLAIISLMIALGFFYRISTILFFFGFNYFFLLERAVYNNHYYLISLISFFLILAPLHKAFSIDVLRGKLSHEDNIPFLWLWIFRFHMGVTYFYGGIAKFDSDWLSGLAPRELMGKANRGTFLEPLMQFEWSAYFYAWSGMLFDLFVPFLLLFKRTRNIAFVAAVFFHINNNFVFSIGVFPMLALMMTLIFYDAGFPRLILPQKIKKIIITAYVARLPKNYQSVKESISQINPIFIFFLGIYIIIQLVVPLRHLTYPGWTTWHAEGHDFAWRMMLRQKTSKILINVTHPETGERRYAAPEDYLNFLQLKILGNPTLLLQFVHYLDQLIIKNAGFDPIISAKYEVSINGRPFRDLVNADLDLSKIPKFTPNYLWVKPFSEP